VLAAALVGWLGVMELDARHQAAGVAASAAPHTPARLARADADLRGARRWNPDTSPDLARALVTAAAGRRADAIGLLEDVVRREPDNIDAWGGLYLLARDNDPAAARRALAARARLDPLSARSR
jgi:predicted Zn-dependent protease